MTQFGYTVLLDDDFAGGFTDKGSAVGYCLTLLKMKVGKVTINGVQARLPDRPVSVDGLLLWWAMEDRSDKAS